jgi:hypothetical protein
VVRDQVILQLLRNDRDEPLGDGDRQRRAMGDPALHGVAVGKAVDGEVQAVLADPGARVFQQRAHRRLAAMRDQGGGQRLGQFGPAGDGGPPGRRPAPDHVRQIIVRQHPRIAENRQGDGIDVIGHRQRHVARQSRRMPQAVGQRAAHRDLDILGHDAHDILRRSHFRIGQQRTVEVPAKVFRDLHPRRGGGVGEQAIDVGSGEGGSHECVRLPSGRQRVTGV